MLFNTLAAQLLHEVREGKPTPPPLRARGKQKAATSAGASSPQSCPLHAGSPLSNPLSISIVVLYVCSGWHSGLFWLKLQR